ncbi:MAG: hypothetical protein U0169_23445 [Polyangiaceae bacterium]
MASFRSFGLVGFTLLFASSLAACSSDGTAGGLEGDDESQSSGAKRPSADVPTLTGGTADGGSSSVSPGGNVDVQDCSANAEGCPCSGQAPVACFTGSADRRNQPGCKDGVRTCEPHGEFREWGACVGEVTTCAPPAQASDAGTPPAQTPPETTTMGGLQIASPNYTSCAALPNAGKRGYGTCPANQVVVIVNDGKAQEMTCCPVSANVLSAVPAEQNVVRTGLCQADEVATGMQDPSAPRVFCTKINATFLKLSSPVPSKYVNGNAPGALGAIARSYNVSDTCICEEGLVVIGGHTASDNKCTEQCVRIEKK